MLTWASQIRAVFGLSGSVVFVFFSCHLPWLGLTSTGLVNISTGDTSCLNQLTYFPSLSRAQTAVRIQAGLNHLRHFRQSGPFSDGSNKHFTAFLSIFLFVSMKQIMKSGVCKDKGPKKHHELNKYRIIVNLREK